MNEINEDEVWKAVVGYEGYYEVSSNGRVRSLDRVIKRVQAGKVVAVPLKGKMLSLREDKDGYLTVNFSNGGIKTTNNRVHRLVALAFIPNPDNKSEVNHINGKKNDNKVVNLCWSTSYENITHSWDKGLRRTKLTLDDVLYIYEFYKPHSKEFNQHALAKKFDIHPRFVRKISKGQIDLNKYIQCL
ncbi:NUMOD4 domain-containing protein [Paenibacillus cymbidii]|uniref:NUMOD4 domain-containing protein n=1 Tax=Paenibacillus cymbidii TaxID=1639034 RepID=UPI00143693A2|nr:NUMOD4 domain-containing protein [Paenibacillus cymbidii]